MISGHTDRVDNQVNDALSLDLASRVIDQTTRRVVNGESVPASDKIVSIFEPHTDIIVKDNRGAVYGHKEDW